MAGIVVAVCRSPAHMMSKPAAGTIRLVEGLGVAGDAHQVLTTPASTADSWLGGAGNWSTAADWTAGVPTSDSAVTIGQTGTGTVTLDTGDTIDSLTITSGNTLSFAASEALVVGADVTVQSGGTLTLAGGDGLKVGGSLSDAGQMTVGAGDTVELSSTPLNVTGTLTVAGTIKTAGTTAVTMGSGTDRLILDPGFSFVGLVQGGGANSTLELAAGAGAHVLNALGTEFTGFGTVTVDLGATWTVDALAAALTGVTITGSGGANTLVITSPGAADLSLVSGFPTIDLAAGNNTVTVADATLSGGSVVITHGASGNNSISAAGDTGASTGNTLIYLAGAGTDSVTGGFENDAVKVAVAAVGGDTLTGGSGTNTLILTTAGAANLSGVSKFGTIDLAAGNNTVTVADATLSGGSVVITHGASGNNSISAAGDTGASTGNTLIYLAGAGTDSVTGGFENDAVKVAVAAVGGDTLTGGSGTNTLILTTAGAANLSGVSKFGTIDLAAGNNTVTVADATLSGGSVVITHGASGNNSISAAGDTGASTGKTLIYLAGAGTDSVTGGFENDAVKVAVAAVGGDTLTGGSGTNTLILTTAGAANLSGVSKFGTIDLAAGNNTVTVADATLSGGSVVITHGASGNNSISAAGDTGASTGNTLIYLAGAGTDSVTGGFENDAVKVAVAAVGGDTLTGGSGTNTLILTTAGAANLSGVSKFGTIDLAAGNNTVTVADATLSGGSVVIAHGASGNNSISAAGDTGASTGKTLIYLAGAGTDSVTGGFENDAVKVAVAAVGGDTLTGGSGTNTLILTTAGAANLSGVSKFGTIDLAAGNNTVTVADATLSGGSVVITHGASGNNSISAAGDTGASTGNTLIYLAGAGTDSVTGGFENDAVKVAVAAVGGDTLTGGSGTNTLILTTAGAANLSGVSKFGTIDLAAGNNTVTVADATLSGGSVVIAHGASGNNSISAAGDTGASTGNTLIYLAGAGTDSVTGGFENDAVKVAVAAVGGDTLTGGSGTNTLILTTAGAANLSGVSGFETIDLASGGTNTLAPLTDTNFSNLGGAPIHVFGGATGNSVDASSLTGTNQLIFTGGAGNDNIVAGPVTTMTGGAGTNQFTFADIGSNDITDFGNTSASGNMIVFRNSGFDLGVDDGTGTTTPQHLDASVFVANSIGSFTNTSQRFAYNTTTGALSYAPDGSGSTSSSAVAILADHASVAAGATGNLFFTS